MPRLAGAIAVAVALTIVGANARALDPHPEALLTSVHQDANRPTPPPPSTGDIVSLDPTLQPPAPPAPSEPEPKPPAKTDAPVAPEPAPAAPTPTPSSQPATVPDPASEPPAADIPSTDKPADTVTPEKPATDSNKDKDKDKDKEPVKNGDKDKTNGQAPAKPQNGGGTGAGNNAGNTNQNNTGGSGDTGGFPMAAIIGIASTGGVLLLVCCGLLLFCMRKRAIKRSNSSYFHFPDADEAGNQALPSTASVDQLPHGAGLAASAAIAKKRRTDSGSNASAPSGDQGHNGEYSGPLPPARAPHADVSPSAPTQSVIRRHSDVSSASSDTIVAPELAPHSVAPAPTVTTGEMGGGKQIMSKVLQRNKSKKAVDTSAEKSAGAPTPRMDYDTDQSGRSATGGAGGGGGAASSGGANTGAKRQFTVKGAVFRVDPRYEFDKALGGGAYGVVCSARDTKTGRKVAIKKVQGLFDDLTDAKRILREVRLLRNMSHDNVLSILDIDKPEDYHRFDDLYIITELMDTDLAKLLSSKSIAIMDSQRRFFTYQILKAMKYIHSGSILHRDLKPANIIINENCDLKVCDFGLARWTEADSNEMTQYVVTRWYRAPELLLDNGKYTAMVDMWAVGCIAAELYSRKALFRGRDVKNQLVEINNFIGRPKNLDWVQNHNAKRFLEGLPEKPSKNLREYLNAPNKPANDVEIQDDAIDFILKLLVLNPAERMTADQALQHPYIAKYRIPGSEKEADKSKLENLDLEPPSERSLGATGVRKLMWQEILKFRPE